jgi:hypothetical protein
MAAGIKSLILDHWRARHTDIAALKEELGQVRLQLARLEEIVAELRREKEGREDRRAGRRENSEKRP